MESIVAWVLGVAGLIGWVLFGKSMIDRREWEKERNELKAEIIRLHKLHRDNEDEIQNLRKEILAINSERERFNERMKKIDKLFDSLGYSEDETND